jgi:hypothetical protein
MKYLYFKSDGTLHIKANILDSELESEFPNPIAVHDDYETIVENGEPDEEGMPTPGREKTRAEVEADVTYSERRAAAYPTMQEQLDKIYHDIQNGTLTQSGDFFTAIKTVKDDNPKT